jgi:hypothetical protein
MGNLLFILLQVSEQFEKPPQSFYVFFIISTIVVHAIVIAIVYYVFKDFFKKQDIKEKEALRKSDDTKN